MSKRFYSGILVTLALLAFGLVGLAGSANPLKGTFARKAPDAAEWTIKFDGKSKFTVTREGKEVVEGAYKITKNEIEFTDEKGSHAEKGDDKVGTHRWKRVEKNLTFTKVKDMSRGRVGILTSGPWEMKE